MKNINNYKNDLRSIKTRKAIKNALLQLIKVKPISEISVKELTDLSGRTRNSFYTHYKTVNDVLNDVECGVYNYISQILEGETVIGFFQNPNIVFEKINKLIVSHKKVTSLYLFTSATSGVGQEIKRLFTDYIYDKYKTEISSESIIPKFYISFFVAGVIDIYSNWLEIGGVSLSELTTSLSNIAQGVLFSLMGSK